MSNNNAQYKGGEDCVLLPKAISNLIVTLTVVREDDTPEKLDAIFGDLIKEVDQATDPASTWYDISKTLAGMLADKEEHYNRNKTILAMVQERT